MCFLVNGKPEYFYPPINLNEQQYLEWETTIFEQNKDHQWMTNLYWKLEKMSCVLVLHNKQWYNMAVENLKPVWDIIVKERKSGYEHRAPNKREKSNSIGKASGCLLDINSLFKIETEPLAM